MPGQKQLERIKIHRFRGVRDLDLDTLGQVNLLVGPNNSGKTSVLEAISVYCAPLDVLQWVRVARNRQSGRPFVRFAVEDLKWLFPKDHPVVEDWAFKGRVEISSTGPYGIKEVHAWFSEMVGSREPGEKDGIAEAEDLDDLSDNGTGSLRQGARLKVKILAAQDDASGAPLPKEKQFQRVFTLWEGKPVFGSRRGPSMPEQTITQLSHWTEGLLVSRLTKAEFSNTKDQAVKLAQRFDPDIRDLKILSPRGVQSSLYVDHARLGLAPPTVLGDGVRRALTFALSLPLAGEGVLLIDEIETSIHTEALAKIFPWIVQACKDFNVQLFATTHSLEAVDTMLAEGSEADGDINLYRLHSSEERTSVRRFDRDRLARIRYERGLDVR